MAVKSRGGLSTFIRIVAALDIAIIAYYLGVGREAMSSSMRGGLILATLSLMVAWPLRVLNPSSRRHGGVPEDFFLTLASVILLLILFLPGTKVY